MFTLLTSEPTLCSSAPLPSYILFLDISDKAFFGGITVLLVYWATLVGCFVLLLFYLLNRNRHVLSWLLGMGLLGLVVEWLWMNNPSQPMGGKYWPHATLVGAALVVFAFHRRQR